MKLTFHLDDTEYDCVLHIRDAKGTRAYRMTANATVGTTVVDCLTVSVTGDACEVVALPKSIEKMKDEIRDYTGDTFVETLLMKAVGRMAYAVYRDAILHTAVTYRIPLRERIGTETAGSDAVHLHRAGRERERARERGHGLHRRLLGYHRFPPHQSIAAMPAPTIGASSTCGVIS